MGGRGRQRVSCVTVLVKRFFQPHNLGKTSRGQSQKAKDPGPEESSDSAGRESYFSVQKIFIATSLKAALFIETQ